MFNEHNIFTLQQSTVWPFKIKIDNTTKKAATRYNNEKKNIKYEYVEKLPSMKHYKSMVFTAAVKEMKTATTGYSTPTPTGKEGLDKNRV